MKNIILSLSTAASVLALSALSAGAFVGETFPMTDAPLFGEIPTAIADACAQEAGVETVDDLITDEQFEIFEGCGIEYLGEI